MSEIITSAEHTCPALIHQLKGATMESQSKRIRLIPFNGSEANQVEKWFETDPLVRQFYYTDRRITDYSVWVSSLVECLDVVYFRIEYIGNLIGLVYMKNFNFQDMSFEIGILVEAVYRRRRIGEESIKLLIQEVAKSGIKKIIAKIAPDNTHSATLFIKLNFLLSSKGIKDECRTWDIYEYNIS